ncbi:MAG: hypothetical protein AAFN10_07305 [Bacteroidota bacterium]
MRILALLTLSFVLSSFNMSQARFHEASEMPQNFKIWGDSGKVLISDQNNVVCEMIELEYITQPRELSMVEVSIKDADGHLMAKRIISSDGGNLHSRIALNRWPAGSYSVQVWIDGQEQAYPLEIIKTVAAK